MTSRLFLLVLLSFCLRCSWGVAAPPSITLLGHFGQWEAYRLNDSNQRVCFMVLNHESKHSPLHRRGQAHLMITQRPDENAFDIVSYSSGYFFLPSHDVQMQVDTKPFNLFADKDTAWSRTSRVDHELTQAICQGHTMTIHGISAQKGNPTVTDYLDISGSYLAYKTISQACGIEGVPAIPPNPHARHKPHPTPL